MKKFETLERIKSTQTVKSEVEEEAEPGPCSETPEAEGEAALTEDQMLELFKETSNFTVRGATRGEEPAKYSDAFNIPCFGLMFFMDHVQID
eukprot:1132681-Pyramimonas_sp.AAC.2